MYRLTYVIVFKGYTAGSHRLHPGSGSNYLCMPEDPQWENYVSGSQGVGTVVGVAYGFSSRTSVFSENNTDTDLGGQPGPCAFCYVGGRSTVAMIPARTQCPDGWTTEYAGYLVSQWSHTDRKRSSYVCWDQAPEIGVGIKAEGQTWDGAAAIYPVEVSCGALPCSTYINERELTCVVCSK